MLTNCLALAYYLLSVQIQSSEEKAVTSTERSKIFEAYNAAKHTPGLEAGRVNRALGVAQSKEPRPYHTNANSCDCPDSQYRPGQVCKHRIAAGMKAIADQYDIEDVFSLFEARR
jgi:hypothetical protein